MKNRGASELVGRREYASELPRSPTSLNVQEGRWVQTEKTVGSLCPRRKGKRVGG